MLAHLTPGADHLLALIEQKQIAVAPHQLQDQLPLFWGIGPWGKAQLHHPFPRQLLKPDQGEALEAVLQLLGQGAALAKPRRWLDGMKAGAIGLPVEGEPQALLQGAEGQLHAAAFGLLGFFKP